MRASAIVPMSCRCKPTPMSRSALQVRRRPRYILKQLEPDRSSRASRSSPRPANPKPSPELTMNKDQSTIVIASAARTPVGSFNGALASLPAHELGKVAIKAALERAGCRGRRRVRSHPGPDPGGRRRSEPARQASINAGIPVDAPAWGMNQLCGSGLRAVALGAQQIRSAPPRSSSPAARRA